MIFELLTQKYFIYFFLQVLLFLIIALPIGYLLIYNQLGLFSDSLSHSLIPGLAGASFLFGLESHTLFWGALAWGIFISLVFSSLSGLNNKTKDSLMITLSLFGVSLGLVMNQFLSLQIDFTHLLFGAPFLSTQNDMLSSLGLSIFLLFAILFFWKPLLLFTIDPLFSKLKYGSFKLSFIFTLITTLIIVSGFQVFGVLLTTGLMILPNIAFPFENKKLSTRFILIIIITITIALISFLLSYQINTTFSATFIALLSLITLAKLYHQLIYRKSQ